MAGERKTDRRLFDKDVLRVGRWVVAGQWWDVTPMTLRRLVINFQQARRHGVRVPVVWNHSHDARDKIGEVVRLYVSGITLRARFWIAGTGNVRQLATVDREVSVEVAEPWLDGAGRRYDLFLTHLAIVNHPVIPDQGPMRRLCIHHEPLTRETTAMADRSGTEGELQTMEEARVDVAAAVELINQIAAALGTSHQLPIETTEADFVARLVELRDRIEAMVTADMAGGASQLSLEDQLTHVTRQLEQEREQSSRDREQRFSETLDRLIADGRLLARDREDLLEAARPAGYSLSLLAPFERLPAGSMIPLSGQSRRVVPSSGAIPKGKGLTDQRVRDIVRDYTR